MKVTRQRVCDICESDDNVCRYRITKLEGSRQRTVTTDLCAEHGGSVQTAMEAAPVSTRGRKSGRPVVSLDEIDAKKKVPAQRKTPARKPGSARSR